MLQKDHPIFSRPGIGTKQELNEAAEYFHKLGVRDLTALARSHTEAIKHLTLLGNLTDPILHALSKVEALDALAETSTEIGLETF
jgi:hypothetical protein